MEKKKGPGNFFLYKQLCRKHSDSIPGFVELQHKHTASYVIVSFLSVSLKQIVFNVEVYKNITVILTVLS